VTSRSIRGMAAQKATDIRRVLAEVENNARDLRDRQGVLENQLLSVPAASWPEAAAKARYLLNLCARGRRRPTPVIAILSRPYLQTLPGSPRKAECAAESCCVLATKGLSILACVARLNCRQSVDWMSQ
jgi:hypothetical protein